LKSCQVIHAVCLKQNLYHQTAHKEID